MSAPTRTPKRNDDDLTCLTTRNHLNNSSPYLQSSKRLRLISMNNQLVVREDRPLTSISTFSRVWRYPDFTQRRPRAALHAPVKSLRFGTSLSCQVSRAAIGIESSFDKEEDLAMGITLSMMAKYTKTLKEAVSSLRFIKLKEVIDLVEEEEDQGQKEVNSEDSNIHALPSVKVSAAANPQEPVVSVLSNGNAVRVDSASKMLSSSLSVESSDDDVELLSRSAFKKLLHQTNKRDTKLAQITSDIKWCEEKLSSLQRPTKKPEEIPREPFVALTCKEEMEVNYAFSSHQGEVLVVHEKSNIEITGASLHCLRPCAWLNDEVINLYMELLKEREEREPKKFLKCHFFNTFFYKKLIGGKGGYDYKSIRRWTTQRKLGYSLIDCDKIFVPIHQEVHWCLAIINTKDKKFQYLDSLGGKDRNVLKIMARYLMDEVKDKNGKDMDVESWQTEYVQDIPKQKNSFDCGMFMIKYADFYSRDIGLCFKQEHMPYFRRRTAKEILKLRAE